MKNILIGSVRQMNSSYDAQSNRADSVFDAYNSMYNLSRKSAHRFLKGEWKEVKLSSPVFNVKLGAIANFYAIKELWHSMKCNILWLGADTLIVKETEIFSRFSEFTLFNYTEPRSYREIEHYLNDDVRYYPATMSVAAWEVAETMMNGYFTDKDADWNYTQIINNAMYYCENNGQALKLKPHLNWLVLTGDLSSDALWNDCDISLANILHFCGSRGSITRLNMMKHVAKIIGLEQAV
jgi:hypothetical protein